MTVPEALAPSTTLTMVPLPLADCDTGGASSPAGQRIMALPARLGSQAPVWALQGFCVQLVGTLSIVPVQEPNRLGSS